MIVKKQSKMIVGLIDKNTTQNTKTLLSVKRGFKNIKIKIIELFYNIARDFKKAVSSESGSFLSFKLTTEKFRFAS